MLFFRSEEQVNEWCLENHLPRREVLTLPRVWALASAWYGDRIVREQARTSAELQAILARVGLTGAFWELPG